MDSTGCYPSASAKVSHVSSGLHRDWNRIGDFGFDRFVTADDACDTMRDVVVIPCGEKRTPLRRVEICDERNSTIKASEHLD